MGVDKSIELAKGIVHCNSRCGKKIFIQLALPRMGVGAIALAIS
jgi:hypothetical protein